MARWGEKSVQLADSDASNLVTVVFGMVPLEASLLAAGSAPSAARARCTSTSAPSMVGQSPWLPLSGLPAKKLVVRYARFCALARSAIWSKRGRPAHLAQVEDCKSDMHDWCFGGLFSRVHGSGQPRRRWAGSPADLPAACARPYLQPGGARLSVGPGICGTSRVTPCVSLLGPYPNSAALAR